MKKECALCGKMTGTEPLYDYEVCADCRNGLALMSDNTVRRHMDEFEAARRADPSARTYREEVDYRLQELARDTAGKNIRLLHIRGRIKELK